MKRGQLQYQEEANDRRKNGPLLCSLTLWPQFVVVTILRQPSEMMTLSYDKNVR